MFFGSKIGQTKHEPLSTRDFLRLHGRNCGLHLEPIYLENKRKEQNITL